MSNHHWKGEIPDPTRYFGFIYLIECTLTGKKYVGKKQYWASKPSPGCKSRVTDKTSTKWKESCWKKGDWEKYTGSSKEFNSYIREIGKDNFVFTILSQHESKGSLHYAEIKEQVIRDVLTAELSPGEYEYFNKQIAAIKFRPKRESTPCSDKLREFMLSGKNPVKQGKDWRHNKTEEEIADINRRRSINSVGKKRGPMSEEVRQKLSEKAKERNSGINNPRADKTIYTFVHSEGTSFVGTRSAFREKYPMYTSYVCDIVNKGIPRNGWRLSP